LVVESNSVAGAEADVFQMEQTGVLVKVRVVLATTDIVKVRGTGRDYCALGDRGWESD